MRKGFLRLRKELLAIVCCAVLLGGSLSPIAVYADTPGDGQESQLPPEGSGDDNSSDEHTPPNGDQKEDTSADPKKSNTDQQKDDENNTPKDGDEDDSDDSDVDKENPDKKDEDDAPEAPEIPDPAGEPAANYVTMTTTVGDIDYTFRFSDDDPTEVIVTYIAVSEGRTCPETLNIPSALTFDGSSYKISQFTLPYGAKIPSGVKKVVFDDALDLSSSPDLFNGTATLEEVVLPSATSAIPKWAFQKCTSLKSVTTSGTITSIGEKAFYECKYIKVIPDLSHVTSMGDYAFYKCWYLDVDIDLSSLSRIPDYAFFRNLVTVTRFSDQLESIGTKAFYSIKSDIPYVRISPNSLPDTLVSIGEKAFCYAVFPSTLTIPDSVTTLGENVFQNASGVSTLYVGTTRTKLTKLEADAFGGEIPNVIIASDKDNFTYKESDDKSTVTYRYNDSGDDSIAVDGKTLQQAINDANDGDTITISKDVVLSGTVEIPANKSVTIKADTANLYTIRAKGSANLTDLIQVNGGAKVTFENVTLSGLYNSGRILTTSGAGTTVTLGDGVKAVSCTLNQSGKGVIDVSGAGSVLNVQGTAEISGNTITKSNSASVRISNGAAVHVTGGTIKNNQYTNKSSSDGTAGILLTGRASGTMSGGAISSNTGCRGTAIQLNGSDGADRITFKLSGGKISDNVSESGSGQTNTAAGAVFIQDNAAFEMTGGEISNNKSDHVGGGVTVRDTSLDSKVGATYKTGFHMTGGTISGNTAQTGGGVYSFSNGTLITGGTITKNTAKHRGGGIYIEGNMDEYSYGNLRNALVSKNSATYINGNDSSGIGGGLWMCHTGDAALYVKNGSLFVDNTAEKAAADISISSSGKISVTNEYQGGGKVNWYQDGRVTGGGSSWDYDPHADGTSRYNSSADNTPVNVANLSGPIGLKSVIANTGTTEWNLKITENTALMGGGIAINGGLISGEPGTPDKPGEPDEPGGGGDDGGGDNPPDVPPTPPTPDEPKEEEEQEEEQHEEEPGERVEGNKEYGYYDEEGNWHFYDEDGYILATGDGSLMWLYCTIAITSAGVLTAWTLRKRHAES